MNNKQAIEQLKDLRDDFTSIVNFKEDVEALDIAIKALERTVQEVELKNTQEVENFIKEANLGGIKG